MTPGKFNLTLYRGDSYAWQVKLYGDTDGLVPVDLTGAMVAAQFRDKPAGTQLVDLNCTVELPNVVLVEFTPDMWDGAPSKGQWDLQVTLPDGQVLTVLAGSVSVTADVTVTV